MPLKTLSWHKIGLPEGRAGTLPELQDYYGGAWPSLAKYFLPTQRLASTIECPKPGGPGCPRQVVIHSHNDIVAVCGNTPKECESVPLFRRDVIIHELKIEKLLSDLARLLQVKGAAPESIMPLTWNLGTYAALDWPAMPVYISLQSDSEDFQSVAITLLAQKEKPFILLVPSRNFCPVFLLETIQNAGAHLVGIDEIQSHQEIKDSAGLLGKHVYLEHARAEDDNYFRLEQDYWQIHFRGTPYSIKQSVGMRYITLLIERAYNDETEIHVVDLLYLVKGRPNEKNPELSRMTKEQLSEIGFDVTGLDVGLDVITPEGKERVKKLVQQLERQIEDAEEYGHTAEALRLREKKEALEDYIQKALGLGGRRRKVSDSNEKARKSVSKAIDNTLIRMGKNEEDQLAVYLDAHLDKGLFCSFRKDPNIFWKIMEK